MLYRRSAKCRFSYSVDRPDGATNSMLYLRLISVTRSRFAFIQLDGHLEKLRNGYLFKQQELL